MPVQDYLSRPSNMACHNYCEPKSSMPQGVKSLLGLGLRYCIRAPKPSNDLDKTIERFKNDARRISHFIFNPPDVEEDRGVQYIPELYIKSDWIPPESVSKTIERCIKSFESTLREQQSRYNKPRLSNLLPRQWQLTKTLKTNDEFISIEADKNLGGCLLLRKTYIHRGIKEHLGNRTVYQPMTKRQAFGRLRIMNYRMSLFASKYQDQYSPAEHHFILQSIRDYPDNIARFRMSLKAHKNPWKMRPIVCCAGTAMNNLSRLLDYSNCCPIGCSGNNCGVNSGHN